MEYKDYRKKITNIIKIMDDSQASLQLGAITIQNILNDSKIENTTQPKITSSSEPPTESKKNKILKELNTTIPPQDLYFVERQLNGANLISLTELDKQHPNAIHYQEAPIKRFNLNDQDIVHAERKPGNYHTPYIVKILKQSNNTPTIDEFKYGIPEYDMERNQYYIEKNYQNDLLSNHNKQVNRYYIPLEYPFNVNNTLIDLAWYKNDPKSINIRWTTYPEDIPTHHESNQSNQKYKQKNENTEKSSLDFDLKQKNVVIIIGDQQRESEYKTLIQEHNGIGTILDGFRLSERNNYYETNLKNADIVINVQNQAKHTNISTVIDIVKDYNLKYAIANGGGIQQVERAIYRALNDLPAYELSTSDINYPIKK